MTARQKVRRAAMIAAFALFPVTLYYFSPVISLQGVAGGIATGSILVFAAQLASSFLLGRAFCGWACPAGGLQELVGLARTRRVNRRRLGWIKWMVWAPWLFALVFLALRAGGIRQLDFFLGTTRGVSVADMPGAIALVSVVLVFAILAAAVGRRAGCHAICWMAPFMIVGRAAGAGLGVPSLRMTAEAARCRACGSCTKACPMSLEVQDGVRSGAMTRAGAGADCILCGSCADTCPHGAIRFTFASGH